ncbi:MAG TPA: hypothetical protein VF638_14820 [Sphingomonas sp.]|jgi:hypothetical protein
MARYGNKTNLGGGQLPQQTTQAAQPPQPPVFTTLPSISPASAAVNVTRTATDGQASNATSYSRRWLFQGAAIGTGTTITPSAGGTLQLEVTAFGPGGSTIAPLINATITAAPAALNPTQQVAPSITSDGTPQVGETLTGNDGSFDGTVVARRWLLGGSAMSTSQSYLLSATGTLVYQVDVRGPTNGGVQGNVVSFNSAAVTVAAASAPTPTPTPGEKLLLNQPPPAVINAPLTNNHKTLELVTMASVQHYVEIVLGNGSQFDAYPGVTSNLVVACADNNNFIKLRTINGTHYGIRVQRTASRTGVPSGPYDPHTFTPFPRALVANDRIRFASDGLSASVFLNDEFVEGSTTAIAFLPGNKLGVSPTTGLVDMDTYQAPLSVNYGSGSGSVLQLDSAELMPNLSVTASFKYANSNNTQADIPNIQLFLADGTTPVSVKAKAILIENAVAGVATVQSPGVFTSSQNGSSPKFKIFEVVNGVETGNVIVGSVAMAAAGFSIGLNITGGSPYSAFSFFNDYFRSGGWQRADGGGNAAAGGGDASFDMTGLLDAQGMPSEGAAGKLLSRNMAPPADASGVQMELSWTQVDGIDATWQLEDMTGHTSPQNVTPQAASGGRRRLRYNLFYDLSSGETTFYRAKLLTFPAGSAPKDVKCIPVGNTATTLLTPTRTAFHAGVHGASRMMDLSNVNGNAVRVGDPARSWASRSTLTQPGFDGLSLEEQCKLANEVETDVWLTLPIYWADDYYLNVLPLVDSLLAPGKDIYLEWGNENTNFTLAGGRTKDAILTHFVQRTGEAYLGDGSGGVGQLYREIAYENKRVFDLMQPTIPNFGDRVVRAVVCFGGLDAYNTYQANGFTNYDFVSSNAAYITFTEAPADLSPAGIKAAWMTIMNNVVNTQLIPLRNAARAGGYRYGGYEWGSDFSRGFIPNANILAFKRSPEYYDCYMAILERLRLEFGDLWCHYNDVGNYNNPYTWSVKEYDAAPTQRGYDAILAAQALAAA